MLVQAWEGGRNDNGPSLDVSYAADSQMVNRIELHTIDVDYQSQQPVGLTAKKLGRTMKISSPDDTVEITVTCLVVRLQFDATQEPASTAPRYWPLIEVDAQN